MKNCVLTLKAKSNRKVYDLFSPWTVSVEILFLGEIWSSPGFRLPVTQPLVTFPSSVAALPVIGIMSSKSDGFTTVLYFP